MPMDISEKEQVWYREKQDEELFLIFFFIIIFP